jgi:Gpi18-like mannosyltransferase
VWGQSDIIYTSFLLAFVRYILIGRRMLAMVMFGIAVSFKPQALFIAPFVGSLFMRDLLGGDRRVQAVSDLLAAPLAFAVMMLPALLAGRPWHFMFTFYAEQFTEQPMATINAPNLYHVIQVLLPDLDTVTYGLAFALAACVALMVEFSWQDRSQQARASQEDKRLRSARMLGMVAFAAVLVPFITPKMHERYFFAATVMTYALALVRPRYWPVAVLMQIAAVLSYMNFLFGFPGVSIFGVVFVAASLVILTAGYLHDRQVSFARLPGFTKRPRVVSPAPSGRFAKRSFP